MANNLDFSNATRGPAVSAPGKTRITIYIDDDVLAAFRDQATAAGRGYQTAINDALRAHLNAESSEPVVELVRGAVRAEFETLFHHNVVIYSLKGEAVTGAAVATGYLQEEIYSPDGGYVMVELPKNPSEEKDSVHRAASAKKKGVSHSRKTPKHA